MFEHIHNVVQNHAVLFSASILIVAYIFIAAEKISKVTIAILGAGWRRSGQRFGL